MRATSTSIVMGLAIAAAALSGCTYRTYGEPLATGYVELSSAPVNVAAYPHTYYQGRDVYLVNDRWMYQDRGRWVYYREEPPQLYKQRPYVQQAPPAYRPSPPRGPQGPASAPPAVRVR